ncbi:polycystic kidney disease protein 1-like 3 [Dipodomys spectabilis]|uniref:polycystic kidney disease protein 1-like 3 n=1 Tax=Dipodomys spectabilis TaxID=105255 RepID=UPI001C534D41|nr:polycystic kidney disease protein 1-like 3 [Dipodomys spectabilis]
MATSPGGNSQQGVSTAPPQGSPHNTSSQVSSEPAKHLSQTQRELKKACETLQNLRDLAPSFQSPAQVPVVNLLIDLTEQILRIPSQNRGTRGSETPATLCHFPPLSVMNGEMEKLQTPKQNTNHVWMHKPRPPASPSAQVEDMLETALLALGIIQDAFLRQNPGCQSSVTLTSTAASVLLSSQNISTLPLSSYTLGGPAPVSLGLPSSSALEAFLNKYRRVRVQVTGLAFNPFQTFDGRNITGSVGSVLLSSGQEQLQVHDLMEDVEIVLWRNANIDTHASSLNASTARFTASVNITSVERSLLVAIEPASPLFLTLYLGFQYPPNHTCFLLTTTLPKSTTGQKDEDYTWVLTPESLQYRTGTYYITAILNETETAWQTPILVSVVTAVTQCYFWDKNNRTWKSSGCQVGPRSTVVKTQCLCDHLTFFGSDFFIVPRTVKVEDTVTLFRHVSNNPVGVSLLASLLGLYMFLAVWAWRKDQQDMQKVKVTVLADNEPGSRFHYLVEVRTGLRPRAACTAQVVATLYGSEGHSRPRHLWDPQTTAFGRGALDVFLLGTRAPLGELHALRLWLHGSPRRCSWYISQVIVSDVATKKKWHFLCNCWLATDLGDFQCDRVFTPASRTELLSFRHLFSSTIVERFTEDHLWLSVATRHPWNQFTRLQRLTCCTTLLLCDMLINVMFWRMEGPTAKRVEPMGPFAVTWLEVLISIQTAVILLPAHLVIRQLFLWIQPREALPLLPPLPAACPPGAAWEPRSSAEVVEELKETVGFLLRRDTRLLADCEPPLQTPHDMSQLVMLLSRIIHSHLEEQGYCRHAEPQGPSVASETQYHFHWYLHRVLRRLEAHLDTLATTQGHQPCDLREAASQLQKLQELLETRVLPMEKGAARETTSFPMLSPEAGKRPSCVFPPALLTSICWLLLGVTSLASAFFTALYSLDLSKDQATSWAVSMMLSALQDTFISQPVKVIVFTFLLSLLASRMPWLNKEKEQQTKRILALWAKCSSSLSGSRDKNNPIYKAPVVTRPTNDPKRTWKKKKLVKLTGDMLVQTLFLILLMTVVYSSKNSNRFFLHQALWKSFSHGFSEIKFLKDFYPWANHTLLPNLYGNYRGFITDGNSFLLGNVLLRQIRIPKATLFPVSLKEQVMSSDLYQEDRGNYGVGWGLPDTNLTEADSIWHYQDQRTLGGYPIQGELATYAGGGYAVRLGRNFSSAARVLQHLEQSHWLDRCTKGLFVEFVVFNANVNLFCVVTLILESNHVGTLFTSVRLESLTSLQTSEKGFAWTTASQVVHYLLVCYYTFQQGCRLKQQKWRFFTRKRNVLDLSIVVISFSILGLDMRRISLHKKNMAQYRHDPERFISFYEAVSVSCAVTHLVGFLVLLATVQLWNLLLHNPRLKVISNTLNKAWDEVVGFLLVILILLSSYAMMFNLLFGWSIADYQTFFSSAVTVVGLLMGISHHEEVIDLHPVLGSFLILSNVILMVFVIINLFVSAILIAFGKERKSLQKEAALTDMLLQKLSNLLGIPQHQNPSAEEES